MAEEITRAGNIFGFSAVGYSSYDAMKDFVNGSSEIIMDPCSNSMKF